MTQEEQIQIAHKIATREAKRLEELIKAGKVPPDWNGIEISWWLSQNIDYVRPGDNALKRRRREFKNTVTVNGL